MASAAQSSIFIFGGRLPWMRGAATMHPVLPYFLCAPDQVEVAPQKPLFMAVLIYQTSRPSSGQGDR